MSASGGIWTEKILPHVPGFIRHDFLRKLFSFVFAVLLTLSVHKNVKEATEYHSVTLHDVEIRVVPEMGKGEDGAFVLVPQDMASTISVTLNVPVDMKDLKSKDMYLERTVTKKQIDDNEPFEPKPENLKFRRSVDRKGIVFHPTPIPMNLDYYDEKTVSLTPDYDPNEIVNRYQLAEEPKLEVDRIRISGPKKVLAGISSLKTEKIPLSNMTRDFSCPVRPVLPYAAGNGDVKILSDAVRVNVKIRKNDSLEKTIPVRVLTGKGVANNLVIAEIIPETVKVTVEDTYGRDSVGRMKIEDLSSKQIHAVVDLSGVTEAGFHSVPILFWSDNDQFKVIGVEPKEATVKLAPASK